MRKPDLAAAIAEKAEAVVGKVLEAEVLLREMAAQFGQA